MEKNESKKDNIDYKSLGSRVKRARKKMKKSQEWLADCVGVTTATISHVETGSTKVSLSVLVNIANTLNVTPDELIADSVPKLIPIYIKDIQEALADCTPAETKVLTEMLFHMKELLKNNDLSKPKTE